MLHRTRLLTIVALGALAASATLATTWTGRAEACKWMGVPDAGSARHLEVWPAHTIAPDGVFVVSTAYGGVAEDVDAAFADLARGDALLEDDSGSLVPVRVEWPGGGRNAALLRPVVALVPGQIYRLDLHGIVSTVRVVADEVPASPAWIARATELDRGFSPDRCFDAQLLLRVPFGSDDAVRIALRATPLAGGLPVSRLLEIRDGAVDAGPWLVADEPYRLELAAYDEVGHFVPMPGGALEARSPGPGDPYPARLRELLGERDGEPPLTVMGVARLYALLLIGLGLALAFWVLAWRSPPAPPSD